MKTFDLLGLTPMEKPDLSLVQALHKTSAFPVLHLGRNREEAASALNSLAGQSIPFGVCFVSPVAVTLPPQVRLVMAPHDFTLPPLPEAAAVLRQVYSLEEAENAWKTGCTGLILKGNEGAGRVSDEASFVLFQKVRQQLPEAAVWLQGGIGLHSTAAAMALGARGVVLDSQLLLFKECSAPRPLKQITARLNGNETRVVRQFRVLVRPESPSLPPSGAIPDTLLQSVRLDESFIPLGQDIAVGIDLAQRFPTLATLFFALREAMHGHAKQARALRPVSEHNALAEALGLRYPIAQGPMTRVSDVPAFAAAVAAEGGLPFVALSLLKGDQARQLLAETAALNEGRTWGAGILGFAPAELRDEQLSYIAEIRPPVVLIAGGRPSQAKPLEKIGIRTFLHVPSVALLDMFLKEGARRFVFEGRECGGHVGPLSSLVLWERQIERLLQEEDTGRLEVFFAGGIHDAFSAAFVSVMAAPLVARGGKIGVLMGTAYLYTREAVETGAIQPEFQQQAIKQEGTVLLETAPGHETRCLESPFTRFFSEEKKRLTDAGLGKQEIWEALEKLNVGRLRIAAKGIERRGDQLQVIPEEEQLASGMYMIGQVAALRHQTTTLAALHREVACDNLQYLENMTVPEPPVETTRSLDVAIIGMACIYPGATNIEEFWANILAGKDLVTEVPDERWNKALYYDPEASNGEKTPSKWGGFIPKIEFDPVRFGIPPQSLAAIDPTQLLSLLVARQALEHAGYGDGIPDKENVSVIIGAEGGNDLAGNYGFRALFTQIFGKIPDELDQALPKLTEDSFPGVLANVISGRITNRLDLGGRNYTVDAACASSLAAIDLACQELLLEKSEMVLAGGADLHNGINDYLMFASTHALSRKGRCATFDASADGIALGEGVAMVVLKRYEDALRDGDTVYAVIKGIGGSSDGKNLGLTAPRKSGQMRALERAYAQAGVSPAQLGLVEAHGTGTVVGDKTELSALTELLLSSGALPAQTHLGSVKTQIGHTKCAAGLAGLIKTALSVYHGIKPPTIHLQTPNGYYEPGKSPFAFRGNAGIWTDEKRLAGISAFGFGGTNFHAVIENAAGSPASSLPEWPAEVLVFRGAAPEDVRNLVLATLDVLGKSHTRLKDIACTLAEVTGAPIRWIAVAADKADAVKSLQSILAGTPARNVYEARPKEGKVAFMFPGQGSQRIDMARDLFVAFPAMRRILAHYPDYRKALFPDAVFDDSSRKAQKEHFKNTRLAQPLLGITGLAIAELLESLGIRPDMLAGHSYGELPALAFAGAIGSELLVPLSEQRADAILGAVGEEKGTMVAVNCARETLTTLVSEAEGIYPVNHNSPRQWVLAGTETDINRFVSKLKENKISYRVLEVSCAFHSPLLAGARDRYADALAPAALAEPALQVWSNTTAAPYPPAPEQIKDRLCEHLVKPVRFVEQVQEMHAAGARIFIETGPGKVLSGLVKAILGENETILHTEEAEQHGLVTLLHCLAGYMATGRELRLSRLFEGRGARTLNFEAVAAEKPSPVLWYVDGQKALPANGSLPPHGALPVTSPITISGWSTAAVPSPVTGGDAAEEMVKTYLQNISTMVQAQRDVLLGYLGHANPAPLITAAYPPATPVEAVASGKNGHRNGTPSPAPVARKTAPDFAQLLLDVVSDKTGYPQEMLGMEMDLEADLSIDSIKRLEIIGALKEKLGGFGDTAGNEAAMEQLAAIKTLNGLIQWLTGMLTNGSHEESRVARQSAPESPATGLQAQAGALPMDMKSLLLNAVSEKTGYPQEMLGMDMDMEADLSIDSIKRLEIIGDLKEKLGDLGAGLSSNEALMEQLTAIKSLSGLLAWLQGLLTPETSEPSAPAPKTVANGHAKTLTGDRLSRFRFTLTPAPLIKNDYSVVRGMHFAVVGGEGIVAGAAKDLLEQRGARVSLLARSEPVSGFDGLLIFSISGTPFQPEMLEVVSLLRQVDLRQTKWIFTISDTRSYAENKVENGSLRNIQGYSGLMKSLDQEYESVSCRYISMESQATPAEIARVTLQELINPEDAPEIVYENGVRHHLKPVHSSLEMSLPSGINLDKDSVILVFGGAQGITAELITRFSEEHPCHYLLVGRSPHPGNDATGTPVTLKTRDEIRKYLLSQGQIREPAELEAKTSRLFKRNQILQTLSALRRNGASVSYHSLDLRNEQQLRDYIDTVYEGYGRIDGVIHGAGLLEDKLFNQKTLESFERVFYTKVTPIRVLAEKLREDVRFVALFSSVASVYGNRGQTDYAAANSVLDHYAWALRERIQGKVIAINWGPWKGTGMVSPWLEKEYERRGIPLIPLREGMESFVNELKYGTESQVLIMAE